MSREGRVDGLSSVRADRRWKGDYRGRCCERGGGHVQGQHEVRGGQHRDGRASLMASDLNGVNGLLTKDNPHLVFVHCMCHRLSLAVSQACTGIADMAALQSVLAAVYSFIQLSPTRLGRFKEMTGGVGGRRTVVQADLRYKVQHIFNF